MRTAIALLALATLAAPLGAQGAPNPPAGTVPQSSPAVDTAAPGPRVVATIVLGQTRTGALEEGDYTMGDGTWADVWYFQGTQGQRVVIELRVAQANAFDPYLQLLDPAGVKLTDDTDGAGNHNSRITFSLRETGRFQVVVNNEGDTQKVGRYTLSLR